MSTAPRCLSPARIWDGESHSLHQGLNPPAVQHCSLYFFSSRLATTRASVLPRTPSLHKHHPLLQCLPGRAAATLPCSVCTSYGSTAKPRKGRKNLQKAEIETASLLLSVLSKESENKATKANTDYSNNLFNLGKDLRKQPKEQKKKKMQRETLCLCCE